MDFDAELMGVGDGVGLLIGCKVGDNLVSSLKMDLSQLKCV